MHKNFTLTEDINNQIDTSKDQKNAKGSHFAIGDNYIDYESPDRNIGITEITETLLSQNFLKLEEQIEI